MRAGESRRVGAVFQAFLRAQTHQPARQKGADEGVAYLYTIHHLDRVSRLRVEIARG
jgi:hypothetical protein